MRIQQSRFMNVIVFFHKYAKNYARISVEPELFSLDTHCYIIGVISHPHCASPSMWRSKGKKSTLTERKWHREHSHREICSFSFIITVIFYI